MLNVYPGKFDGAILKDKPDIQVERADIGVEVTHSLLEQVRYGMAQYSQLTGKDYANLSTKKIDRIMEMGVLVNQDINQNILYAGPGSVWGSTNDTQKAYSQKLKKLNGPGYRKFRENNLFIFAEFEEEDEIRELVDFVGSVSKDGQNFDYIYVYTGTEIYSINAIRLVFERVLVNSTIKEKSKEKAIEIHELSFKE